MKKILVATDFSTTAFHALEYAAQLAKHYDAEIILLHANDLSSIDSAVMLGGNAKELATKEAQSKFTQWLHDIDVIHQFTNIQTGFEVGEIIDVIKNIIDTENIWLTIMGTTGTSKSGVFWGSKSLSALRHLNGNVLLVPKEARFTPMNKLLLSVDLKHLDASFPSNDILQFVKTLNSSIDVLYVHELSSYDEESLPTQIPGLETIAHNLIQSSSQDLSEAVQDAIDNEQYDSIIVLPKKYNLWESLFHSSKSEIIAKASAIPIIAIHGTNA